MADTVEALGMLKRIEEDMKVGKVRPELWCIVNLIFHTSLEKKEICNLKIQDVLSSGKIVDEIVLVPPKRFPLPPEVKEILNDYVQNLSSQKGSSITGNSPLFPSYAGVKERKLTTHLEKYGSFNFLRSGGVKYFYETVMRRGPHMDEAREKALADTALHFDIEKKTVKVHLSWFILEDSQFLNEARALREHEILLDNKAEELINQYKKEIKKSVMNAKNLPNDLRLTDPKEIEKQETYYLSKFLEHDLMHSIFASKSKPPAIETLLAKPEMDRFDPVWVKSLEKEILDFIESEKRQLTPPKRADLQKEKQEWDEEQREKARIERIKETDEYKDAQIWRHTPNPETTYKPEPSSKPFGTKKISLSKLSGEECYIIGYIEKKGVEGDYIEPLAIATREKEEWTYRGQVEEGFTTEDLKEVSGKLQAFKSNSPCISSLKIKGVQWVKPELKCEVTYDAITPEKGLFKRPVFKGLSDELPEV